MTNTVVRRKGRGSEVSLTIAYSFRAVNSGVVGRPTCDFRSHTYAQGKRENTTRAIKSEIWFSGPSPESKVQAEIWNCISAWTRYAVAAIFAQSWWGTAAGGDARIIRWGRRDE